VSFRAGSTTSTPASDILKLGCAQHDADDRYGGARVRFDLPDGVVYLDGNSLPGALPVHDCGATRNLPSRAMGLDLVLVEYSSIAWGCSAAWRQDQHLLGYVGRKWLRLIQYPSKYFFQAAGWRIELAWHSQKTPKRRVILSETGRFPDGYLHGART
jgi:kynureninase